MKKKVFLVGDASLVAEYVPLLKQNGMHVVKELKTVRGGISTKSIPLAIELTNLDIETKKSSLIQLEKRISAKTVIISSSTTVTMSEQATWLKHPDRLIGIGALPSLLDGNMIEFAASERTSGGTKRAAEEFATSLGKEFSVVQDSVGLVMPRILCCLINEACFAMMESVAAGNDIDNAMKLATNYPQGPVEWAERVGWNHVLAVMRALHEHFGEDRYRPAPLLRELALKPPRATM